MSSGEALEESRPHLLFFVTEDWYFCSHRLPLAIAAREAGYRVSVLTRESLHGDQIRSAGLQLIHSPVRRSSVSVLEELKALAQLYRIYRACSPDIVHNVALKPVIYGTLVARLIGCRKVVNALGGLGYVFSGSSLKARVLRPVAMFVLRYLLNLSGTRLILQNPDDRCQLVNANVAKPEKIRMIRGAGVDLTRFVPRPCPSGTALVILASRMLWDKGVGEFVEAAKILRGEGLDARFALVGDTDAENPVAVPGSQLSTWAKHGVVEWWGHREDMPEVFALASIVALPSYYREGIPKVLLEAAASGKAIVTTDMPGCREVVADGQNGLLVPPRDAEALAGAIKALLQDTSRCEAMGRQGRERAEKEFSVGAVIHQTLLVYRELMP